MTLGELLKHPAVRGVCLGCCVRTRVKLEEFGHAHLAGDPYAGFVCLRNLTQLRRGISNLPAASTSIHELAHLISNEHRGQAFHRVAKGLGIAKEAAEYHPARKRKKSRT